jgi:hypothetical protein
LIVAASENGVSRAGRGSRKGTSFRKLKTINSLSVVWLDSSSGKSGSVYGNFRLPLATSKNSFKAST